MKLSPIHYAIVDALYQLDNPYCYDLNEDESEMVFFILAFHYFLAEALQLATV